MEASRGYDESEVLDDILYKEAFPKLQREALYFSR